jgi:hypothetical protein
LSKIVKTNGQKMVKKLSKSVKKVVKKVVKKLSKSCEKVVKKLQKVVKKLTNIQNSTNSGGGVGCGVGWGNSSSKAYGISFADRPKAKRRSMQLWSSAFLVKYLPTQFHAFSQIDQTVPVVSQLYIHTQKKELLVLNYC